MPWQLAEFIGALIPTVLISRLTDWLLTSIFGRSTAQLIGAHAASWTICIILYGLVTGGWKEGAAVYGAAQLFWLLAEAGYRKRHAGKNAGSAPASGDGISN